MKSVLVPVDNHDDLGSVLENALAIARATDAHLEVLQVVSDDTLAALESFGGIDSDRSAKREFLAGVEALEAAVRKEMGNEDVEWEFRRVEGDVADTIIALAALSDLIVVGRDGPQRVRMLGDLLHRAESPILVPGGNGHRVDPLGPVIIAWDGSFEVAKAVRDSLGLLKLASEVHVVRVTEHGEEVPPGLYPLTRVLEYLSREDVHGEYSRIAEVDGLVSRALLKFAEEKGAGLMVMGGYSHSRLRERLFGGTTKRLLEESAIALVLSH
ncbi:universal stress protein [Sphingomicrobium marinum]|uniref:universal stress protein n=1 Tax=Sphingomicrobium marinum TaxID=1227950 RepID=UPI0022400634|nr:universal stress protein [Sphingomicrobium marinum]